MSQPVFETINSILDSSCSLFCGRLLSEGKREKEMVLRQRCLFLPI